MTEQEAIKMLRYRIDTASEIAGKGEDGNAFEDMELAIKAMEKQIAKKPKITRTSCGITFGICPNCGTEIDCLDNPFYHIDADCLQKLDWSEV